MDQILSAVLAIIVGVGVMVIYFYGTNWLLDTLLKDRMGPDGVTPIESRENQREAIRPWLFVAPALIILTLYLIYPALQTAVLSFGDSDGNIRINRPIYPDVVDDMGVGLNAPLTQERFERVQNTFGEEYPLVTELEMDEIPNAETVGDVVDYVLEEVGEPPEQEFVLFRNYEWMLNSAEFGEAVRNNIFWLLVPFLSTVFGLLVAVLADRVRWGTIAKSLIFMPMAISFVGASVIWKFVYDANLPNPGQPPPDQIGVLNAIIVGLGGQPQDWIALEPWNNFFLMVILIWIQTGFAMVLLSAALRGVPEETLEAARIDGANDFQVFFRIMIPQIMSTILVVLTTITIVVLKVFDIVAAMTNGQFGTQILANLMYDQAFRAFDEGRGSVVALVIMIAVIPILVWNIRRFQREEMIR